MSKRERILELIELYCDAGRRSMVPENELEANAPTIEECLEAYHEQDI